MDLVALKAELTAGHPDTGAYDADAATAAAQINTVNRTRNLTSLSGDVMFQATDSTEFAALTDVKKQLWVSWCNTDRDPHDATNVAFVQWVFGGGSDTVTALTAARIEDASRAEELGLGKVRTAHIEVARTL